MATYRNTTGGNLEFPSIIDKDGNVLVALAGDVFDGPDGLIANGVELVSGSVKAAKADKSAPVDEPAPADEAVA